jgi:DNA-binding transcriptional LysR family regulator
MDIPDIRYFLKVAEHCHLGRAAEELHVSQPALSKCISRLEASYGVQLFDRAGRGITLTEAGMRLRDRYLLLAQDLKDIQRDVSTYRSGIAGTVRVGCAASIASYFLPMVCRRMQETAPDLRLQIKVAMDDVLQDELRIGSIDITLSPERSGPADDAIISKRFLSDTVVVVARVGHPLVGAAVKLEDMLDYGWVLPTPAVSTRQWLERVFSNAGLPTPDTVVSSTPLIAAPHILAATNLLSFASRRNLQPGSKIVEIPLPETTLRRSFEVGHRARSFLSPAVRYFITLLEHEAGVTADDS